MQSLPESGRAFAHLAVGGAKFPTTAVQTAMGAIDDAR